MRTGSYDGGARKHGHVASEAFMLMDYKCMQCRRTETIWNSRDGVTPFIIGCRWCDADAKHINWQQDHYAPNHKPKPGERVFAELTDERALHHAGQIYQKMIDGPPEYRRDDLPKEAFIEMILDDIKQDPAPDLIEWPDGGNPS